MAGKKPLFSADAAEEYFSTLLTYYRNTANDIFKRDNEGRYVSDQIYSAEYQKYLGMQIAMREVLEYFAKFELGDTALRQQDHFRDITKKVEPLTLDEMRQMDGEPVWVQSPGVPEYGRWAIVEGVGENCLFLHDDFTCHDYGKTWLAYRHKQEEGTV